MSVLLVFVGMIGISSPESFAFLAPQPESVAEVRQLETTPTRNLGQVPLEMTIGSHLTVSITDGYYTDGVWTVPESQAAYLTTAAIPGEASNIIIYGHNKPQIFGPLWRTKSEDIITITTADGSVRQYRVELVKQITTDDLEYLQPTDSETLTIYTCAGWLDRERFLVRATPV